MEKKDKVRPGGSEDRLLVSSLKQHRYAGQDEGGLSWGEKEHTNMNKSTQKQLQTQTQYSSTIRWRPIVYRWNETQTDFNEHTKITNTNTVIVKLIQVKINTPTWKWTQKNNKDTKMKNNDLEVEETHKQINKHARQLQSHRYFITSMNAQKHKHDTRQDEGWLCRGEISHTD